MNGMNFKPFIAKVLDSLSDSEIKELYDLLNSHSNLFVNRSLVAGNLTAGDKGIGLFTIQLDEQTIRTGYLLYNDTYCVLLGYISNSERIVEYDINPQTNTYSAVKEYLTTDYLRHEVAIKAVQAGQVVSVQPNDIDSVDADGEPLSSGQIIISDGEGKSEWHELEEGSAAYLIGIDSEGNIIIDEIPEGITVDTDGLNAGSNHAVANSVVTAAINDVKDNFAGVYDSTATYNKGDYVVYGLDLYKAKEDGITGAWNSSKWEEVTITDELKNIVASLLNGSLVPNKSSFAFNLIPVSKESGETQEIPFINQGTGTGNGTHVVDTGETAQHLEKQGNTVCVNQLVNVGTETLTLANGHTYLTIFSGVYAKVVGTGQTITIDDDSTDKVIDLTQWFNGNIPQDLLDNPSHFSWYYNGDLSYNTGTLVDSDGRYLVCTYRQQWDEEWELGSIDNSTGQNVSSTSEIRAKNYIRVNPNTRYCLYIGDATKGLRYYWYDKDKNFISSDFTPVGYTQNYVDSPSNAIYLRIRPTNNYGKTYKNDITISLYYATGDGYNKYYPYKAPKVYDTGNEVLRSAGSVKDSKAPDGTITRRVGVIDLGDKTWTKSTEGYFVCNLTGLKYQTDSTKLANLSCAKYTNSKASDVYAQNVDKAICTSNSSAQIWINDSSYNDAAVFKTAMSGVYLYYELATPTTEQGTPFSENIDIDDYGTMYWLDTNNTLVEVPQGCKIFYPAWYVGFIDTLGQREDIGWDAENIASKTDLIGYVKQTDLSSEITVGTGFTNNYAKAYKTGNVITLDLLIKNESGDSIVTDSTTNFLVKLGDNLLPSKSKVFIVDNGGTLERGILIYTNGVITTATATIPNNTSIYITVSYTLE